MAEREVRKSASMRGSATLTTDSSTKAIVEASTAQISTQRCCCVRDVGVDDCTRPIVHNCMHHEDLSRAQLEGPHEPRLNDRRGLALAAAAHGPTRQSSKGD